MTNRYVRSTDGSDSDNGSTWALAKATLVGAANIDGAGDTIFVSQDHAESVSTSTQGWAGTTTSGTSQTQVVCCDDSAATPTALRDTATVTASSTITINGVVYQYGINYVSGGNITLGNTGTDRQVYDHCSFTLPSGTAANLIFGNNNAADVKLTDSWIKLQNSGSKLVVYGGRFEMRGGGFLSGTAYPSSYNVYLGNGARPAVAEFVGVDFGAVAVVVNGVGGRAVFRDCVMDAFATSATLNATRLEAWNCTKPSGGAIVSGRSAPAGAALSVIDDAGALDADGTFVLDGGAAIGGNGYAWIITQQQGMYARQFRTPPMAVWCDTAGSPVTVHVEVFAPSGGPDESADIYDDQAWIEVEYPASATTPLTAQASSRSTAIWTGSAGAAYPDGDMTWSGSLVAVDYTAATGRKMSVTVTPQQAGWIVVTLVAVNTVLVLDPVARLT